MNDFNTANALEILELLKSSASNIVESETVEFKEYTSEKSLHNDNDLVGEISAFANFKGGILIIGIRDGSKISDGKWENQLVGFPSVDIESVLERIKGKLQSAVDLRMEMLSFESKYYLVMYVRKHRTAIVLTSGGKAFIREGRSSRPMTPEELEKAVKSLQNYDWSADFIDGATDEDLLMEDVNRALDLYCELRKLSPKPTINGFLEAIEAKKNGLITKGGLLFLGKESAIKKYIGDIEFRFSWKEGVTLKKNEVWSANLWRSVEFAKAHFNSCVRTIELKYKDNVFKIPNLDPSAFHEAFLNAIVHRDYAVDGMVTVEFSGSRLQITSPGSFYGGVNSDNIYFHEPRHRNKALARMLMEYKFVDRAGMGILRMSVQSLVYGRKFPNFEEQKNSIRVAMEAEYTRPGIFVLTREKSELYVPDLVLLNCLYEKGHVSITEAGDHIKKTTHNTWSSIEDFLERWSPFVELCGTKNDIYICIKDRAKAIFDVEKPLKVVANSSKYVALFRFLKKHGVATSEDISGLFDYSHSSTKSRFLTEIEWLEKGGKGVASKWSLIRNYR